ncbi:CRAL/TRIO domain-containing protein [Panus rudis PR-1116 ss-1]|nr:CRAL/TRIO domain-containing protein [Panus rudis PR-1116 ss-1]
MSEPIPVPDLRGVAKPQGTDLTAAQQKHVDAVLAHFTKEGYKLPEVEDGELSELEKYWLSYECILRYLRATKWAGADVAIKRIEGTLRWRREFGLYDHVNAEHVEPEAVTGKMISWGFDVDGRPALYLVPSRQNTEESKRQIEFCFWLLERVIDQMGPGVETLNLMINFADRAKNPSFGTSKQVLDILQTHYPEHLGRAIIINVPWLINAFFKLITPFVDPVTRVKMRFNPQVVEEGIFKPDGVWKEFGGEIDFVYDHDKYWNALVKMCEERKKTYLERWRKLGGKIGIKEWDVRGGDDSAASETPAEKGEKKEEKVVSSADNDAKKKEAKDAGEP